MHRWKTILAVSTVLVGTSLGASGAAALPPSGMPDQATEDMAAADVSFLPSSGLWGDLPGGVSARPYVVNLALTNDGVTTPIISDGTAVAPATTPGDVTAVVAPFNLCLTGQTPAPGVCYATPNRVGITLGYATSGPVGTDLAAPSVALNQTVTASTVIDLTIGLNTLGKTLRWTWVNGDLLYWSATGLGTAGAELHLRVHPVATPIVDWSLFPSNGCTATPIFDCAIGQSQGEALQAGMTLSLDDTLDPALTGAVFATRGAVNGYLEPGGTSTAPVLDLQMASAHVDDYGAPQIGELQALIPAQTLTNLYGVTPADATSFFTTTRQGSAGTQDPPTFTSWTVAGNGTDGLLIDVSHITFSAPTYSVRRRRAPVTTSARRRGARTTIQAGRVAICRRAACTATVFAISDAATGRTRRVAAGRTSRTGALRLRTTATRLAAGTRYTLVLRYAAGKRKGKLVTTGVGRTS